MWPVARESDGMVGSPVNHPITLNSEKQRSDWKTLEKLGPQQPLDQERSVNARSACSDQSLKVNDLLPSQPQSKFRCFKALGMF